MYNQINENKEELKKKVQTTFTKVRNEINKREDELLLEIDKKYEELYGNEKIFKESEKLPNKINISLEKGKLINNKFDNNKISSFINDCLNIENNIKDIKYLNESIQQCNKSINEKISFDFEEEENLNEFLDYIKNFGTFENNNYLLKFSKIINKDMEKSIINWIKEKNTKKDN